MSYAVKEVFYTLQGEGAQSGSPAVFCRFAGCNLWSGRETDRASAICKFCDTDFLGINGTNGGKYESAQELASVISAQWPPKHEGLLLKPSRSARLVVLTGGEPLLQIDGDLIDALKDFGFRIAVESNGTVKSPRGIDWLTISPKTNANFIQKTGTELKLVYPQNVDPEIYAYLDFEHFFLSPLTSSDLKQTQENTRLAIDYCLEHPHWKLTYQYHKFWNKR